MGDKTIAFWLMDADMYDKMSLMGSSSPRVERGIALHKMVRPLAPFVSPRGFCTKYRSSVLWRAWTPFSTLLALASATDASILTSYARQPAGNASDSLPSRADPADHHDAGRRVVPQLHGQRVWVRIVKPCPATLWLLHKSSSSTPGGATDITA